MLTVNFMLKIFRISVCSFVPHFSHPSAHRQIMIKNWSKKIIFEISTSPNWALIPSSPFSPSFVFWMQFSGLQGWQSDPHFAIVQHPSLRLSICFELPLLLLLLLLHIIDKQWIDFKSQLLLASKYSERVRFMPLSILPIFFYKNDIRLNLFLS